VPLLSRIIGVVASLRSANHGRDWIFWGARARRQDTCSPHSRPYLSKGPSGKFEMHGDMGQKQGRWRRPKDGSHLRPASDLVMGSGIDAKGGQLSFTGPCQLSRLMGSWATLPNRQAWSPPDYMSMHKIGPESIGQHNIVQHILAQQQSHCLMVQVTNAIVHKRNTNSRKQ
jgi:hypothetical protein